ncbi:MAG: hypothetical protein R3B40_18160 [Polyangiales bacterium]
MRAHLFYLVVCSLSAAALIAIDRAESQGRSGAWVDWLCRLSSVSPTVGLSAFSFPLNVLMCAAGVLFELAAVAIDRRLRGTRTAPTNDASRTGTPQ